MQQKKQSRIGKPGVGEGSLLGCTMGLIFAIMAIVVLVEHLSVNTIFICLLAFGISALFWVFGLGMIRDD